MKIWKIIYSIPNLKNYKTLDREELHTRWTLWDINFNNDTWHDTILILQQTVILLINSSFSQETDNTTIIVISYLRGSGNNIYHSS